MVLDDNKNDDGVSSSLSTPMAHCMSNAKESVTKPLVPKLLPPGAPWTMVSDDNKNNGVSTSLPAMSTANPTNNDARSTQTVPDSTVVPSISEAHMQTTASQAHICVDVINDKVIADTANTPSTSTKSPFTKAITGCQMSSTTNAVTRTTPPPTNHQYFNHANSFAENCNDRVPVESWVNQQGHLKAPPNIVQVSVANNSRAKQNYALRSEHFPAHAYPRTTVTRICAYNKNVQQPSTKKL